MTFIKIPDITPSQASWSGTLRGSAELHSDNARHYRDRVQQGCQSYSRSPQDCPEAGAEGEQASQGEQTAEGLPGALERTVVAVLAGNQPLHQELDKDHSHRRTHRYNLQAHQDRSKFSHKHDAHQKVPAED